MFLPTGFLAYSFVFLGQTCSGPRFSVGLVLRAKRRMSLDCRLFCSVPQILRKWNWNSKKGVNNNIRGCHISIFIFPFVFLRESKQSGWSVSKRTFKLKPTCDYCSVEMETNEKQYCAPVHPSLSPIYHCRFSLFRCFDCAPTGAKNTWGLCGIILSWGVYSQASRAHLYYICTLGKRCALTVAEKPAPCHCVYLNIVCCNALTTVVWLHGCFVTWLWWCDGDKWLVWSCAAKDPFICLDCFRNVCLITLLSQEKPQQETAPH